MKKPKHVPYTEVIGFSPAGPKRSILLEDSGALPFSIESIKEKVIGVVTEESLLNIPLDRIARWVRKHHLEIYHVREKRVAVLLGQSTK